MSLWNSLTKRTAPFFVIAGTNVVEDCSNITLRTAEHVKAVCDKLSLPCVFKGSFDKANRTAYSGYRGVGLEKGLEVLEEIKSKLSLPVITDVHETIQVSRVASVVDIIQIPSFLCRQTDLLIAAANTNKIINIKKGQFASVQVMQHAIDKVKRNNPKVMVCERGSTYGPADLVFGKLMIILLF